MILWTAFLLGTSPTWAAVTAMSVDPATVSAVTQSGTGESLVTTVWGGYAGPGGDCSSKPNNALCNSCTVSGLSSMCSPTIGACAYQSINPNLILTVSMAVDQIPQNATVLAQWGGSTTTALTLVSSTAPTQNGQTFQIRVTWGEICQKAGMNADCTASTVSSTGAAGKTGDLIIGLAEGASSTTFASGAYSKINVKIRYQSPDVAYSKLVTPDHSTNISTSSPFTDFSVFPGDEKVYVQDIWRGNSGPDDGTGVKWRALRVFYSEYVGNPSFCSIPLNGANYADLEVTDRDKVETSLKENNNKVTGLTNEVDYMFTAASVDEASIVTGFLDMRNVTSTERYTARPGEVVGLLDGQKCFIATAAFGSPLEPHVEILRQFRNRFLLPTSWGQSFVRFYYKHSPPIARYIAQNEWLRTTVRGALWPFVWMAQISLSWGLAPFLTLAFISVLGLFVLKSRRKGQKS